MPSLWEYPDPEVKSAAIRLADALCQLERNTDNKSVLIIKIQGDYVLRLEDGKIVPDFVENEELLSRI